VTEQTVPVPVELLKKIRDKFPIASDGAFGGGDPLARLAALIPTPPKVGDALTEKQIEALPNRAVVVDQDGDLWVKGSNTVTLLGYGIDGRIRNDGGTPGELAGYKPRLAYLPETV
jgi:hypothetical protein